MYNFIKANTCYYGTNIIIFLITHIIIPTKVNKKNCDTVYYVNNKLYSIFFSKYIRGIWNFLNPHNTKIFYRIFLNVYVILILNYTIRNLIQTYFVKHIYLN